MEQKSKYGTVKDRTIFDSSGNEMFTQSNPGNVVVSNQSNDDALIDAIDSLKSTLIDESNKQIAKFDELISVLSPEPEPEPED